MSDWIFAFFHLFLLVGVVIYAFYSLFQGNVFRFVILSLFLTGYYFIVLHKAVKKEIERKREIKRKKNIKKEA
jgi:4-hydroxybenzoate polyprenyltransferase